MLLPTYQCCEFESGLRPEIKQFIGFHEIRVFPTLVNKFRIYDKDNKARASYYKGENDKRGKGRDHGKPYGSPSDNGKKKMTSGSGQSGGEVRCFKYGYYSRNELVVVQWC